MIAESKNKKRFDDYAEFEKLGYFNKDFQYRTLKGKSNLAGIQFKETEEWYHFELKKPGYIKDDFNFFIGKNSLVITTEKVKNAEESSIEDPKTMKHSYCYPSAYFKKELHLPNDILQGEFIYDYKDGVLSFDFFKSKIIDQEINID